MAVNPPGPNTRATPRSPSERSGCRRSASTRMPIFRASLAQALPTAPKPTMASVLPFSISTSYFDHSRCCWLARMRRPCWKKCSMPKMANSASGCAYTPRAFETMTSLATKSGMSTRSRPASNECTQRKPGPRLLQTAAKGGVAPARAEYNITSASGAACAIAWRSCATVKFIPGCSASMARAGRSGGHTASTLIRLIQRGSGRASIIPRPGLLFAWMVGLFGVPLQLRRIEVDRAQVAGGVALGLILEVRRVGIAALAASGHRARGDGGAEINASHEAVAAAAVDALGARILARRERGQRAPDGGGEFDRRAGQAVIEFRMRDGIVQALEAVDLAPGRLPASEVRGQLVHRRRKRVEQLLRRCLRGHVGGVILDRAPRG